MTASDLFALVALVISSGGLFIQIRSWWVSVPRLFLSTMPEAEATPEDGKGLRAVLIVTNRGSAPTVITHMMVFTYKNLWAKLIDKPRLAAVVKSPQVPAKVGVNDYWASYVLYNDKLRGGLKMAGYISAYALHTPARRTWSVF